MKRIIFTLLALVGTMSMNAQLTPSLLLKKGGKVVKAYTAAEVDEVVFEKMPFGQGYAEATDIGSVKWIQLWEGGPKFAEYNVGAENNKPEDYGGYYAWGGSQDKVNDHNEGESNLTYTGDNITDTATKLWGSKWRMPTSTELDNLLKSDNCNVEWKDDYNGTAGLLCTGMGDYKDNSVFLPAAGNWNGSEFGHQGSYVYYWSSTANSKYTAFYLEFNPGAQRVYDDSRSNGFSVRAVLAE